MNSSMVRSWLPAPFRSLARQLRDGRRRRIRESLRALSERDFDNILRENLQICQGDVVFIHSSLDGLKLDFSWLRIMQLLRNAVGKEGTLLFPTYPKPSSLQFLREGHVFDVRRTPSFMGALTEIARRTPGAVRSLHPTKSVCALGPAAEMLCAAHHGSPYPYDSNSPYFKFLDLKAKAIGLGITTARMSFVHTVDDYFKQAFPVRVYDPELFHATCVDQYDRQIIVNTYAHDMSMMKHDVSTYVKRYIPSEICEDINIHGMNFFRADARRLFDQMVQLAQRGTTIFPRRLYNKKA
jgi:aminoglycoside 3-N-acetyltransferase